MCVILPAFLEAVLALALLKTLFLTQPNFPGYQLLRLYKLDNQACLTSCNYRNTQSQKRSTKKSRSAKMLHCAERLLSIAMPHQHALTLWSCSATTVPSCWMRNAFTSKVILLSAAVIDYVLFRRHQLFSHSVHLNGISDCVTGDRSVNYLRLMFLPPAFATCESSFNLSNTNHKFWS